MRHRPDVLPRPPHQERQPSALVDVCNRLARGLLEDGEAPGLVRLGHVNEMVGHALSFSQRRFGGADVQAAIEQPRVCRDDLAVQLLGELQADFGLADCSRADDQYEWKSPLSFGERGWGRGLT